MAKDYFSYEEILKELKRDCDGHGSPREMQHCLGLSDDTTIYGILKGKRRISDRSMKKLGYEKITLYRKIPGPANSQD